MAAWEGSTTLQRLYGPIGDPIKSHILEQLHEYCDKEKACSAVINFSYQVSHLRCVTPAHFIDMQIVCNDCKWMSAGKSYVVCKYNFCKQCQKIRSKRRQLLKNKSDETFNGAYDNIKEAINIIKEA